MKHRILNSLVILSILLMQVFTIIGVTPSHAAGAFTLSTTFPNPVGAALTDMWGSAANDVFIVGHVNGYTPIVYHNDGSSWSYVLPSKPAGLDVSLNSVWGAASNDVYAVGSGFDWGTYYNTPLIYHYDGSSWTYILPVLPTDWFNGALIDVWGTSASDIYVAGYVNDAGSNMRPLIYHYDGSSWTIMTPDLFGVVLTGIWGSDANDVYMAGDLNYSIPVIYHYDGNSWLSTNLPIPAGLDSTRLLSIWGAGASDIYAVGSGPYHDENFNSFNVPVMYHWDGSSWTATPPALPGGLAVGYLNRVWGLGANDIYAVGNAYDASWNGVVLAYHYDGSSWAPVSLTSPAGGPALKGIWASSASDVYLAGMNYTGSYSPLMYHTDAIRHTVTFDKNAADATGAMDPQGSNSAANLTANAFTRTGYTFAGWNTQPNGSGTSYANGATYDFSADMTLYAQWTPLGNALNFDGSNDYVSLGNPPALSFDGSTPFTIETWMNKSSAITSIIFSKLSNTVPNPGYEIYTADDGTIRVFLINSWPSNAIHVYTNTGLSNNVWHHVAVTYDGSKSVYGVKIYVDGVLQTNVTNYADSLTGSTVSPASAYIGVRDNTTMPFPGTLDEVRVWNTQRTQQEIQDNMNAAIAPQTGLVAYYKLDHGAANGANTGLNTAIDSSGNILNGTLTNFALSSATSNWVSGNVPLGSHTVTFSANGGTGTISPQTSSAITNLTTNGFTRTGYSFTGWNTQADGGGTAYTNGESYSFVDDLILYAQWEAPCLVTNSADSGNGSLRWALANCPADGAITFDSSLSGGTITLTTGELLVDKNITIDGSALASQITLSGNSASRVFNISSGAVMLKNLIVANGNSGFGAGAFVAGGATLNVSNSTFSGNVAPSGNDGGGIYSFGTLNITNSTFSGNSAGNMGAGIMNNATATISNSTFSGNTGWGGGIVNNGTLTVLNSTFAGNTGGITNFGTLNIKNTILANSAPSSDCYNPGGTLAVNTNNLFQDGSCSPMLSGDPLLDTANLQNNGGPTKTIALQAGSPALGAGDAATCAADPINNLDQRGTARPQGSGSCDIGAFESSMSANHTVTFNANGGSGTMNPQTAYASAALTPNTFTLNGYSFTGWNTAADGKGVAYGNQANYDFSADLTLYAQWRSNLPIVTSITRSLNNPTSISQISFRVNFSEAVTGVDKFDFQLSTTGSLSGFSISTVSNTGNFRTVTVSAGSGSGTLCLNLIDNNTIKNLSLVPLGGPGLINGNFTSGECYSVDREAPKVQAITRVSASPTSSTTIAFNLTFSEGVTGVDKSDFTIVTSGTIAGTSITSVSGTGATRTVTVTVASGTGSVRLDVVDNDTIKDTLLNSLGGSGLVNGDFSTGESYNVDLAPPSVLSITRVSANPTTAAKVHFLVTFSKVVTGVDKYDFNLLTPGITGASILAVSGTGSTRIVTVATGTGSGTIQLDLIDNDTIKDAMLYKLGGTGTGNGNFLTGEIYTVR